MTRDTSLAAYRSVERSAGQALQGCGAGEVSEGGVSLATGHIQRAVGRHLNWRQGLLVPEAIVNYKTGERSTCGNYDIHADYLADLMWVTGAKYATEIEIKVSASDWRADLKKGKWRGMPSWIARFVYAVPESLGVPDFVPDFAGVWHVRFDNNFGAHVRVARAPKRVGKDKVPQDVIDRWLNNLYFRYWHQKLYFDTRMPKMREAA